MRWRRVSILLLARLWAPIAQAAFDLRHPAWDALLKQQVVVGPGGVASTLRYAALQADSKPLRGYLASVSAVTPQPRTVAMPWSACAGRSRHCSKA